MYNYKARDVFCELKWQVPPKKVGNFPGNGKLLPSVSTIIYWNVAILTLWATCCQNIAERGWKNLSKVEEFPSMHKLSERVQQKDLTFHVYRWKGWKIACFTAMGVRHKKHIFKVSGGSPSGDQMFVDFVLLLLNSIKSYPEASTMSVGAPLPYENPGSANVSQIFLWVKGWKGYFLWTNW